MKPLITYILLALFISTSLGNASSLNQCIDNDNKSSVTLHMDMRNWLVLKSDGKSLAARIIGQAKDHGGFVIGQSKPIRNANESYLNVFSYHPTQLKLIISKILVASDDTSKPGKLLSVIRYTCQR